MIVHHDIYIYIYVQVCLQWMKSQGNVKQQRNSWTKRMIMNFKPTFAEGIKNYERHVHLLPDWEHDLDAITAPCLYC